MSPRTLKTVAVVSLVLNVFLAGSIAGGAYWLSGPLAHKRTEAAQQRGIRFAAADLSAARQQQLRDALRKTRRESLPLIRDARDGRIDLAHALAAPDFDRKALDDALSRTREADVALRARIEGTVADFAATLTPDERLKLVGAMERYGPLRALPPDERLQPSRPSP
ncbi:periplasmic heavy metal sensor [Caballeronia insecticola]|uniref:Putative membrane-associated protein n=1 Tax=Caballeronia insecticola TaxID=758793 RepID=R4WVA1_9BURK|nr:periplasmic heavy metal sensor [Caballeronia insecticola]BAN24945.1 putative membrane-associated protein [Caballeronia insecticola]